MTRLAARYAELIDGGELRPDPQQAAAVAALDDLQDRLEARCADRGWIARLLDRKPDRTRGAYLWGAVGRGKSMLMDLFYEPLKIERNRRVHFPAFMIDAHAALKKPANANRATRSRPSRKRSPRACACSPSTRW